MVKYFIIIWLSNNYKIYLSLKMKTNHMNNKIMETKIITRVNNVDIIATSDEQLVPIRPICEALGIDVERQRRKIQEDEDLNSTAALTPAVGADGKEREMLCLPIRYIFGWMFTINPKNVKPEAQEAVRIYRRKCYDALYSHFFGTQKRQIEQNRVEISLLEELADLNQQQQQLKQTINEKRKKLEKLREERLKNEPQLFD
jgi:antirepressor protein ant